MNFVSEDMKFIDFKDFCKRRDIIKYAFVSLSLDEKQVYKWYVYSNRLLLEWKCDKIWEFLNEPFGSFYYVPSESMKVYL